MMELESKTASNLSSDEAFWRRRAKTLPEPKDVLTEWFWMHFLNPVPSLGEGPDGCMQY